MKENQNDYGTDKQTVTKVILAALVCVIAAAVCFFGIRLWLNRDKTALEKAFIRFSAHSVEYFDNYISIEDLEKNLNQIIYGESEYEYSLNVSGIADLKVTVGLDGTCSRSFDEQKLSASGIISVMNNKISEYSLYADGTWLYAYVPDIMSEGLSADTVELSKRINCDIRPFGDGNKKNISLQKFVVLSDEEKNRLKDLYKNAVVTKDNETATITLQDETSDSCRIYHVTTEEPDDINITVWIDDSDTIRRIDTDSPLIIEGEAVDFHGSFTGSEDELDQFDIQTQDYHITWEVHEDGKIAASVEKTNSNPFFSDFLGTVNYDEENRTMAVGINSLEVGTGYESIRIFGDAAVSCTDVNVTEHPSDDYIDILSMNLWDYLAILSGIFF